jgi:hypothetical protein
MPSTSSADVIAADATGALVTIPTGDRLLVERTEPLRQWRRRCHLLE